MSKPWATVKLGEVISHRKDFVRIDDLSTYKRCRVQLHAKGIVLRDLVTGSELKTKEQQICRSGDFLVAEIDAKVGGYGIVPDELAGAIVSSHYFLFEVDRARLDRNFLGYFIKTPDFFDQVSAIGTTNYAAIRPSHVLEYQIPLPPLTEQQRIVAKIDELASKIEEASSLRQHATKETDSIMDSAATSIFQNPEYKSFLLPIEDADLEINREYRNPTQLNSGQTFMYIDISTLPPGPSIINEGKIVPVNDAPSRARRVIKKDDIIISTVRPNLRAIAKIGEGLDNQICSTGFAVISCAQSIDPDFLLQQFCSPFFIDQCVAKTTGGHYPAINDTNLRKVVIVVPPLPEQRRIVSHLIAVQTQVKELKQIQDRIGAELDALMLSILDKAFKGEL